MQVLPGEQLMTRAEHWAVLRQLGHGEYVRYAMKEHRRLDMGDADSRAKAKALAAATKAAFEQAWGTLPILSLAMTLKTQDFDLTFIENGSEIDVTMSQDDSELSKELYL